MYDTQPPTHRTPVKLASVLLQQFDTDKWPTIAETANVLRDAQDLIGALDTLLGCYRLGRKPSEKLLTRIEELRVKLAI